MTILESKVYDSFMSLVRLGIGHSVSYPLSCVDWQSIQVLAEQQGLSAIALDGLEELRKNGTDIALPEKVQLTQWIGQVLQGYEYRYEQYCRTLGEMAGFYNRHNFKMMVLKGYACSLDWPKPEHRPCGDIDIWLFGRQAEADAVLAREKRMDIDSSHHHHTVFYWRDFMVENHFDFINVHHHKFNSDLERVLKDLAEDDTHSVDICGEKVYLPSPNLHALFLLKHTMMHFAADGITLRQLLDWAFFVKAHSGEIDWDWLSKVLEQYGMTTMFNVFNAICVEDFGFDASVFHSVQFSPFVKDQVLADILAPRFHGEMPKRLFPRILFKLRRWRANQWKHKLCYKESLWSAFWSGVWSHILKPSSI